MDKETIDYCLRDYKNKHFWQSIGVITTSQGVLKQVFKCSQCDKAMLKTLDEIVKIYHDLPSKTHNALKEDNESKNNHTPVREGLDTANSVSKSFIIKDKTEEVKK